VRPQHSFQLKILELCLVVPIAACFSGDVPSRGSAEQRGGADHEARAAGARLWQAGYAELAPQKSCSAAIAFYTVTSIAPVLLIVGAIAGLVFGHEAAQNSISRELGGLMGAQTAEVLQSVVANAANRSSGIVATMIGIATPSVAF
jgi:hypothetical protein